MSIEESSFIVASPKINMFEKDLSVHNPNLLNKNLSLSNHINLMRQSKEYRKLNKRRIIFLTNKLPNIDSSITEEKEREVDSLNTSKNEGNKNFDENPHYSNKNVENKSKTIKFEKKHSNVYIINTGSINSLNVKTNSKTQTPDGISPETEQRINPIEEEKKIKASK